MTGVPKGNQMKLSTYTTGELLAKRDECVAVLNGNASLLRPVHRRAIHDGLVRIERALVERGVK